MKNEIPKGFALPVLLGFVRALPPDACNVDVYGDGPIKHMAYIDGVRTLFLSSQPKRGTCVRCGETVVASLLAEYAAYCPYHDEDLDVNEIEVNTKEK